MWQNSMAIIIIQYSLQGYPCFYRLIYFSPGFYSAAGFQKYSLRDSLNSCYNRLRNNHLSASIEILLKEIGNDIDDADHLRHSHLCI